MAWLYLRYSEEKQEYYAGRTGHANFHDRADSGKHGRFAVGMDSKELAVKISSEEAHITETEAIQALRGIVGKDHSGNKTQLYSPETGYQWYDMPEKRGSEYR